jgi:thiamine pyrophosphokinase
MDSIKEGDVDSVVFSVLKKITDRAKFGKEKYKTDLDRTDLKTLDWITHAQEELMDAMLYLEKLKMIMSCSGDV